MNRTHEVNAQKFGRRLASCSPTNFAKTSKQDAFKPVQKAIYVQEAEPPEILSTSVLKKGMKMKDLPLLGDHGMMASTKPFDRKGMFKLNVDKIQRFDGHRSIYYSDKKRAHEPMHDSTSPMH